MLQQEEQWLLDEKYNGEKTEGFFADYALLQSGTPLAYLIGSIPFLGCTIHLDSHPLIPRPETEYWTEKAISTIRDAIPSHEGIASLHVLDLCAGSGAIGVAIMRAIPNITVDFAEIDSSHLPTIDKNIKENLPKPFDQSKGLGSTLFESDLFEKIPPDKKYNFIVTNPPYIDPKIDRADRSVKLHEPHLALYGGNNGMDCIRQILEHSSAFLAPRGQLWIEHEPEQASAILTLAQTHQFTCTTHTDQYHVERYSVLVLQ